MEKPKRLAEIPVKELYPEADRVEMDDILGKEIIISDITLLAGQKGDFAVVAFAFEGDPKPHSVSCGGYKVVQRLVEAKVQGWFPLPANITKVGRTYEVK